MNKYAIDTSDSHTIDEMRGWLMDCMWEDVTADDIAVRPAADIVDAVQRHYDGGTNAFLRDLNP